MSYRTQAKLAVDSDLRVRVTACAVREGETLPESWAQSHMWRLSGMPGWDDAYSSALANGVAAPGVRDDVITDGMILAAVQSIRQQGAGV